MRGGADVAGRAGIELTDTGGGRGGALDATATDVGGALGALPAEGAAGAEGASPTVVTGIVVGVATLEVGSEEAAEAEARGRGSASTAATVFEVIGASVDGWSAKTAGVAATGRTCPAPEDTSSDEGSGARCSDCTSGCPSPSIVRRDPSEMS
jgi:hypothetical protein